MTGESIIKVKISMPASTHLRLREHARSIGTTMSRLCCESALRAIDDTIPLPDSAPADDPAAAAPSAPQAQAAAAGLPPFTP